MFGTEMNPVMKTTTMMATVLVMMLKLKVFISQSLLLSSSQHYMASFFQ